MFNFFKNKAETKSISSISNFSQSLLIDSLGNVIGQISGSNEDQILNNISTQTIINKQFAIISQPDFVVKKKTDKGNIIVDEPIFNDFLDWIYNPNTYPSPNNKDHILKYLLQAQNINGIYGIIFIFKKVFDKSEKKEKLEFKNIVLPKNIKLISDLNKTEYQVSYKNYNYNFALSPQYGMFAYEDQNKNEIHLLQVDGNYDNLLAQYKSEFSPTIQYIKLQNLVATFAVSFYGNSCFPSQIVTISYNTVGDMPMNEMERKKFSEAVEDIKNQIKSGKGSSGGTIMASNPNITIDVKALNIAANSSEIVNFDKLAAEKIFSYVDQGSYSVFMGIDEYSNNTIIRLKSLYDATFRTFNYMCLKPMTKAMQNIIRNIDPKKDVSKYYLSLDTSGVRIFQESFLQLAIQLNQNNLYTINELREMISKVSPDFKQFGTKAGLDVVNAQLSGNKTKAVPETIL